MRPLRTPRLARCLIALAGWLLWGVALAQDVAIDAPEPLRELIRRFLKPPSAGARGAAMEAYLRDTQRIVSQLLATEGYFSPHITVSEQADRVAVKVDPGARTRIGAVDVQIQGPVPAQRRDALRAAWGLPVGAPFREEDWNNAKQGLLRQLLEVDFAGARLVDSRAEIDPAAATARLHAAYDSGPRYVFGDLQIKGLSRYSPDLVARYNKIRTGDPYNENELLALQSTLQNTPYFSSVTVEAAPTPGETGEVVRAPVVVNVRERAPHRVALGTGFSTNTGARAEINYRGTDFLGRAWQLEGGLRLEQLRQSLYADIHLPPDAAGHRDSFGALAESEDIQGLRTRRFALGAVRAQVRGSIETRYALTLQREGRQPRDAPSTSQKALAAAGTWIWRRVDNVLDPRDGHVLYLQVGGGTRLLLSDQNFLRLYGRYQQFFPVGARDVFSLRGELGSTLAASRRGIPENFLFRAGGSQSVRGYAYQSLGVKEGNAVVGGRYLATASAEYTHWLAEKWGAAAFVDAGNAGDDRHVLSSLAVGYGAGARWKSPVGPLAVDLAYGQRDGRVRLHFSLAVAF